MFPSTHSEFKYSRERITSPWAEEGKNKFVFQPLELLHWTQWEFPIEALWYLAYCTESSLIYLCKFPASVLGLNLSYYGAANINLIAVPVQFGFSWNMSIKTLKFVYLLPHLQWFEDIKTQANITDKISCH